MSVAKRKWIEMNTLHVGDHVSASIGNIKSYIKGDCEYTYESAWIDGTINGINNDIVTVFFPEWEEEHDLEIDLVKPYWDTDPVREWTYGTRVHVNNYTIPGETSKDVWWEAFIAEDVKPDAKNVFIEWAAPCIGNPTHTLVSRDMIRRNHN